MFIWCCDFIYKMWTYIILYTLQSKTQHFVLKKYFLKKMVGFKIWNCTHLSSHRSIHAVPVIAIILFMNVISKFLKQPQILRKLNTERLQSDFSVTQSFYHFTWMSLIHYLHILQYYKHTTLSDTHLGQQRWSTQKKGLQHYYD